MKPLAALCLLTLPGLLGIAACQTPRLADDGLAIAPQQRISHGISDPEALTQLGRYFQGLARHNEAIDAYRRALSLAPTHAAARNGLGTALAARGDYPAAIAELSQASALAPDDAAVLNNLGYARLLAGDLPGAIQTLQQAAALAPSHARIQANLAHALTLAPPTAAAPRANGTPPLLPDTRASTASPAALATRSTVAPAASSPPAGLPVTAAASAASLPVAAPPAGAAADSGLTVSVRMPAAPASVAASESQVQPIPLPAVARPKSDAVTDEAGQPAQGGDRLTGLSPTLVASAAPVSQLSVLRPAPAYTGEPAPISGLEVANGNGVNGLARRVAAGLGDTGGRPVRLTNVPGFAIPRTEIQYRPDHEAAALALQDRLREAVPMRPSPQLRRDIRIRLVLGRDTRQVDAFLRLAPLASAADTTHP